MENCTPVNPDEYQKSPANQTAVTILVVVLLTLGAAALLGWLFLSFMQWVLLTAMRAA